MILDLIAQLHVARADGAPRIGDHCAAARNVALLEREARRGEPGARTRRSGGMLPHEALQMLIRRGPITARLFELGEREQCVVGIWRQRVLHDHLPIVAFRIGGGLRQRATPEERVAVCPCPFLCRAQHRVDKRAARCAVTIGDEPACALEDGIRGRQ